MANVLGTFRAAVEEHLLVTVINDWNLNPADLAPYKVLILRQHRVPRRRPDRRHRAIRRQRAAGWSPASIPRSSTSSAIRAPNFALARVLGVEHRGRIEGSGSQGRTGRKLRQVDRRRLLGEAQECL